MIDIINEKLKGYKISFNLESAVFNKDLRALSLSLVYPDECILSEDIRKTVKAEIYELLPDGIKTLNIKYKKNYFDDESIKQFVHDNFKKKLPIVRLDYSAINFDKSSSLITLDVEERFLNIINSSTILDETKSGLQKKYYSNFEIQITPTPNKVIEVKEEDAFVEDNSRESYIIELKSIEPYIGECIQDSPILMATMVEPDDAVCVAGKIRNFSEHKTKEKITEDGKVRPEKPYYTFEIFDYSGSLRVVYFPTKATLSKAEKLSNDQEVCIFGSLEESNFDAGLSLRPKLISLCTFEDGFFERVYTKPVPKKYRYIFPEEYKSEAQSNLFFTDEKITNPYLLDNTFVVFDLETTGTAYNRDKIIEIGAVKMVGGKLTETFSCLIDPEIHIPEDATKVNNITDDMVRGCYTIKDVLPDFFKFCENSIMVSYVIGFDFNFVSFVGKQLGYAFTHKTFDAFVLAKSKMKGVKNYKLTTIAKELGIDLENAHRAVFDAVAAAEVMRKLLKDAE
mgnify:FL=1